MIPEVKLKLILGGMGYGKTTLLEGLRKRGFKNVMDSDECRVAQLDGWRTYNDAWFMNIWGGIALLANWHGPDVVVLDHGGWFALDKRVRQRVSKLVQKVLILELPLEDAVKRVKARGGSDEEVELARVNHGALLKISGVWKGYSLQVHVIDAGQSEEQVLTDAVQHL